MDYQKLYNSLLKKSLELQKDQIALLKLTVDQNTIYFENSMEHKNADYENNTDINNPNNNDLIEWLHNINIDDQSIKKVCILFCFKSLPTSPCVVSILLTYSIANFIFTIFNFTQLFLKLKWINLSNSKVRLLLMISWRLLLIGILILK